MNEMFDYIIIGAGITGIAAGRILQQKGNENYLILEAENSIGGLLRTKNIEGHYFDIGGGHVLHSKYPEVLNWIYDHIPKENFYEHKTKVLIDLEGNKINFPIELNLWQLPKDVQVEYLYSYLTAASKNIKYTTFEHWVRNYLGDKIADNYMIPYNNKLWCTDITKLNTDWLTKTPKSDIKLILKTIVEKKSNFNEDIVSHASFLYPKQGGFQTIIDAIARHVSDRVLLSTKVDKLKYCSDHWVINGTYKAKKVINTVPWPLLNIEGLPDFNFKEEFSKLEVLSNVVSLWERDDYTHDAHWMYIPDPKVEQHREFYIKNIAPHSKKGGVMTDINYTRWVHNNKKWSAGEPLEEHVNIWAYPLPTTIYKKAISNILNFTREYNLIGLGRWGQWSYFNVDHCIKQVMEFFKDEDSFNFFNKEWFKN